MAIKWANNASSTLASSISNSATSITVASSGGSLFPTLSGSDYFYATLVDSANTIEIVKVTARSGDVMTVVRAQEGTSASAYIGGDKFELRPTAAGLAAAASGINITDLPANTTLNSVAIITASGTQTLTNKTLTSPAISSPSMTGIPTTPTATTGTDTTQVASTAFVNASVASSKFDVGTAIVFAQTNAPTGWTKSTTHNNKALRVVSGAASSGGTVDFTVAFAAKTPAGTVNNTTLTAAQIPDHTHSTVLRNTGGSINSSNTKGSTGSFGATTTSTATGGAHNHTFTGTAIDLAVKYVDVIIATKD